MKPRDDAGFTLIELLLVMVLALLLLTATLTSFNHFYTAVKRNQQMNDLVNTARNGVDIASRQLRNLATARQTGPQGANILVATDSDLVFQTFDPARTWVRYCLDTTGAGGAGASASREQLWETETSSSAQPTAAMLASCPGTGWARRRLVADNVTNRIGGQSRYVFRYGCVAGAPAGCPASAADFPRVTTITIQLYVDPNPGIQPAEQRVESAIYLRNQNEPPVAAGTATQSGRTVILNATPSYDPEGRTLLYDWVVGPNAVSLDTNSTPPEPCLLSLESLFAPQNPTSRFPNDTDIGQGIMLKYTLPASYTVSGSTVPIQLVVRDPGCLYNVASITGVKVP
jgi:prepilin-type N-terminal cleavage/methylation domain-containing protein